MHVRSRAYVEFPPLPQFEKAMHAIYTFLHNALSDEAVHVMKLTTDLCCEFMTVTTTGEKNPV